MFIRFSKIKVMKILVDIPDDKASFALDVLRSLVFVKKAQPISEKKSLLIEELKEAVYDLKLIKQGKLKAKPARELLSNV